MKFIKLIEREMTMTVQRIIIIATLFAAVPGKPATAGETLPAKSSNRETRPDNRSESAPPRRLVFIDEDGDGINDTVEGGQEPGDGCNNGFGFESTTVRGLFMNGSDRMNREGGSSGQQPASRMRP